VFSNRTLNLRSVQTVGYDMDYTLIHYHVSEWERAAFQHARQYLVDQGWPVADVFFDPDAFTLGLVFDTELGNLVKATRFGYVIRAVHGSQVLPFRDLKANYSDVVVELSDERFQFMNTLFDLSHASLWCQLVDLFDAGQLPAVRTYRELNAAISDALSEIHIAGALKAEIVADPERFVDLEPEVVHTLSDQRAAGKKLVLITNSEWSYTRQMMAYAFDRFCADGTTWRDLFDLVIVSAAKPRFFSEESAVFRVQDEENSLFCTHSGRLEPGPVYVGGNAKLVEESLGQTRSEILYVGDHLFGDVHVTKNNLRWRTALVTRRLEPEIRAALDSLDEQEELTALMKRKVLIDRKQARLRMAILSDGSDGTAAELKAVTTEAVKLDREISVLAVASSSLGNSKWGPLMRAGSDKSLYARQVEKYADVYTSRVSNFTYETPFAYLRAARLTLPHDLASAGVDPQIAD
jgi:5'-nucleotidase